MVDDQFEPVTIETDNTRLHFSITNVEEVATRLRGQWPGAHKGAAYQEAVKACLDHIRGKKNAGAVRASFIGAAKEADIFVGEGRNPLTFTWTETRSGIFDIRLDKNAAFLVTQEGAQYEVLLPGQGRVKCSNRNQVERVCRDYYQNPPPDLEEPHLAHE